MAEIDSRDRTTILVHFYRAMVGRADIWRMRMDATTNWAIGTTAAVVTFALGNDSAPHTVLPIGSLLTVGFLLLEARRLTFYHLWQQRVLILEQQLVRPALDTGDARLDADALDRHLAPHLGRTVPSMSIAKAASRRLRRVYLFIFGVQWLAWVLELSNQPGPARSFAELVARAHVGPVPGALVFGASVVLLGAAGVAAFAFGGVDRDRSAERAG